ncbi:hypothetical protein T12_11519 [Trichinella patagoniensis]|uniref:Uncharacterized protein n=1 Tax=Trichinella patagoniensis TaxID=990121 RepID=A0A0V0ZWS0_9BILA|nr:hypothetical protein T12_11519 [Trichinella patagoniensis]
MPTDRVGRLNYAMPAFSVQKPNGQAGRGKSKFTFFHISRISNAHTKDKKLLAWYTVGEINTLALKLIFLFALCIRVYFFRKEYDKIGRAFVTRWKARNSLICIADVEVVE